MLLIVVLPWLAPGLGLVQRVVLPPVLWMLDHYEALARAVGGV